MQILILGAGYAGLRTAIDLDRLLRSRGHADEVTLVDQFSYHQLVQLLHQAATAAIYSREASYELAPLLSKGDVRFVAGRVAAIAPLGRQVRLADGTALGYDRLVIALGAETAYNDVPGAREHTMPLRTLEHATRIRDHVVRSFEAAARASDPAEQRVLMTTAIVGGGYTGCQLAGELAAWADDLCAATGAPRGEVRIALLDRSAELLKQFGPWATREAEQVLDALGVSVYLNTVVEAVEPRALRVAGDRVLRAATLVWAGGVQGPDLLREAGLPTDAAGRVLVDRYLRVRDQALIFAAGDCAAVPDGANGATVPATASYAMRQGSHLAETLLAEVEGSAPRAYEPLKLGELVSLGPHYAVGNPLGVPVTGYPALLLKKGVEQYYRATIEGPL
ncbi:MAG TPA: NAD(P)/FAD-dependent oxidoreductase [Chloroflexaceae bacterium]|nr:NAD(P)/FAD-dependent oxidoreductase [Chloroflexaceae bacterium]